jgi:hypothetical protein
VSSRTEQGCTSRARCCVALQHWQGLLLLEVLHVVSGVLCGVTDACIRAKWRASMQTCQHANATREWTRGSPSRLAEIGKFLLR